jgi:hypothetical protein
MNRTPFPRSELEWLLDRRQQCLADMEHLAKLRVRYRAAGLEEKLTGLVSVEKQERAAYRHLSRIEDLIREMTYERNRGTAEPCPGGGVPDPQRQHDHKARGCDVGGARGKDAAELGVELCEAEA